MTIIASAQSKEEQMAEGEKKEQMHRKTQLGGSGKVLVDDTSAQINDIFIIILLF